jgi:hypothetical protein
MRRASVSALPQGAITLKWTQMDSGTEPGRGVRVASVLADRCARGWISAHRAISSGWAVVEVCSPAPTESVIGDDANEGVSIVAPGSSLRIDGNLP